MLKIGLDVMGGDFAPRNTVMGAIDAFIQKRGDIQIYLFGDEKAIAGICFERNFNPGNFVIVNCSQVVSFTDHPVKAFIKKKDSSIAVGFRMLADKKLDAFIGAGNTGAMMTGCCTSFKLMSGLSRPSLSVEIPNISGKKMLLLDVGFNSDCRPEMLYRFGILGDLYAKSVFDIDRPRVSLLNIGAESTKGNSVAKGAYELMQESGSYNFIGNVEADHIFTQDVTDVVVTDGFSGNIFLKQAESIYDMACIRGINDEYLDGFNYELYGGTPVLGIPALVIVGHGRSTAFAIKNMILKAADILRSKLMDKFNIFA